MSFPLCFGCSPSYCPQGVSLSVKRHSARDQWQPDQLLHRGLYPVRDRLCTCRLTIDPVNSLRYVTVVKAAFAVSFTLVRSRSLRRAGIL